MPENHAYDLAMQLHLLLSRGMAVRVVSFLPCVVACCDGLNKYVTADLFVADS